MSEILLDVQHLSHVFKLGKHAVIKAVDDVSFQMQKGEIFGLVGESGSGKSVTMKSVMGLLPRSAKVVADAINYKGEDLTKKTEKQLQKYRGREMAMIRTTGIRISLSYSLAIPGDAKNKNAYSPRDARKLTCSTVEYSSVSAFFFCIRAEFRPPEMMMLAKLKKIVTTPTTL